MRLRAAAQRRTHLRSRLRLAVSIRPKLLADTLAHRRPCSFSLDELRYEYPLEIVPAGETPDAAGCAS